jgi:hypothetical protein
MSAAIVGVDSQCAELLAFTRSDRRCQTGAVQEISTVFVLQRVGQVDLGICLLKQWPIRRN